MHLSIFIVSNGLPNWKCALGHSIVAKPDSADCVFVSAASNCGKDKVVNLQNIEREGELSVFGRSYMVPRQCFEFQKKIFDFSSEEKGVHYHRRLYPTKGTVKSMMSCSGHDSSSSETALALWGRNEFDIPLPSFIDLYTEHLLAPFFLFQVFCLCLWSLDEYWYYSAITLCMLMMFEAMQCKQRQNSVQMLRAMRRPAIPVYRLRRMVSSNVKGTGVGGKASERSGGFKWEIVSSDRLVPGDVISVAATIATRVQGAHDDDTEEQSVTMPCDVVIIGGSCVVNEAMLTGESTPQVKESVFNAQVELHSTPKNDLTTTSEEMYNVATLDLDIGSEGSDASVAGLNCRRYQLYGGTSLLQHSPPDKVMDAQYLRSVSYPQPPNKGCIGAVVRTGFGTKQVCSSKQVCLVCLCFQLIYYYIGRAHEKNSLCF